MGLQDQRKCGDNKACPSVEKPAVSLSSEWSEKDTDGYKCQSELEYVYKAVEGKKISDNEKSLIESFKGGKSKVILALNKIDLLDSKEDVIVKLSE